MPAELIAEYIRRFWGYGRWERPVWFLGMEEGMLKGDNGAGPVSLPVRLDNWRNRGSRELENAPEFCHRLDLRRFFPPPGDHPPRHAPQRTWDNLIKVYLAAKFNREATNAEVRAFRSREFGRDEEGVKAFTLIELFPLPSPDTGAWSYGPLAEQLPYLINRDTYRHTVFSARADTLRQKLATYKPVAVLCYSKIYRELFEGVIGQRFPTQIDALGVARIVLGTTQIFLCDHVVAVGTRNARLTAIGQYIQNCLTPSQRNLL